MKNLAALWLLLAVFAPAQAEWLHQCRLLDAAPAPAQLPTLVIIIDDVGYGWQEGRDLSRLPGAVTLSILPYSPYGADIAREAHHRGKEIMLHVPMSNLNQKPLGPGGLTAQLTEADFRTTLDGAINAVPYVRGVNNHMGSELTQRVQQMQWVMDVLARQQLFFVDSRTSAETVAAFTAAEYGIPHLSRHVFLDNERSIEAIAQRFEEAKTRAREEGLGVMIGHPYEETITFLQQAIPQLDDQHFRLASVADVLGL